MQKVIKSLKAGGRRERVWFLLKDVALYGGGMALGRLFALATMPLLARYFLPSDFGLIDIFSALTLFLMTIMVFGLDSGVARFIFQTDCERERKILTGEIFTFQLIMSTLASMMVIAIAGWLGKIQIVPALGQFEWKIIGIQVPFLVIINFSQNLLKWTYSRTKFLIVSVGLPASIALVTYIAVLIFSVSVTDYLILIAAITGVFGGISLWFVSEWVKPKWNWPNLKRIVVYSFPFGVVAITSMFIPVYERAAVAKLGMSELGYYAAGAKIALIATIATQSFQMAWGPFSMAIHKNEDAWKTYDFVLRAYSIVVLTGLLILSAASGLIINLLASKAYYDGKWVVFPLAFSVAIISISSIIEVGISISMKSRYLLYGQLLSLVTIFALLPRASIFLGIPGVAFTIAAGNTVRAFNNAHHSIRLHRRRWKLRPLAISLLITLSFGLMGTLTGVYVNDLIGALVYGVGACVVMLQGWSLLHDNEREYLLSAMSAIKFTRRESGSLD